MSTIADGASGKGLLPKIAGNDMNYYNLFIFQSNVATFWNSNPTLGIYLIGHQSIDIKIFMTVSVLVAKIGNKVLPIDKLMVRLWDNCTLKYYATVLFVCF